MLCRQTIFAISVIFFSVSSLFAQPLFEPDKQAILDDIGITEADIMQFGVNFAGRMEEFQEKFQQHFKEPPTSANYREYVGQAIDELGIPLSDAINQEMKDFFTPEQYQKIQTRFLQFSHGMLDAAENTTDTNVMGAAMIGSSVTLLGPPDFLEFTDDQKKQLQELQKETLIEFAGLVVSMEEKRLELIEQLNEATTDEERERIQKLLPNDENVLPKVMPILMKAKKKYEKILTDKQKAKIQEVLDDMPDYLWAMMPQNQGKERAWRPGANSWRPGMGVPENIGDTNRETRSTRPEGKRSFPGQEENE